VLPVFVTRRDTLAVSSALNALFNIFSIIYQDFRLTQSLIPSSTAAFTLTLRPTPSRSSCPLFVSRLMLPHASRHALTSAPTITSRRILFYASHNVSSSESGIWSLIFDFYILISLSPHVFCLFCPHIVYRLHLPLLSCHGLNIEPVNIAYDYCLRT